jgi:hypothetical protein
MIADRYTKAVLTAIALALTVLAVRPSLPVSGWLGAVHPAPALAQTPGSKYELGLPKGWGKIVAFSNNNLLLEGPDQTLRIVDVEGKAPEYPKVKVVIHWQ